MTWETSDVITITDGSGNTATYYISGIDASTGKATFEHSSGDELGAGPYSAVYGTQPEKNQTYSATAPGKLYMTASSENNVLTFNVQCALMEINLTKEGESVKKIEVTGKPDGKEETTYTLTCTQAVSIAEQKSFYIALPAGTYTKIVITDSEGKVCTLNVKDEGIPVTVNQIIPATFEAEHLIFPPKGALPGVFSVSATKKVYFSKGNLWAGGDKALHFEANQYSSASSWNASHVSHFTWSSTVEAAVGNSNSGDNLFCDESESHKVSVDSGETIYYALSKDEWAYLFSNHSYKWASVNGVNGYVIAPDGFAGTLADTYTDDAALAAAGNLVFLPAAARRNGSTFYNVGVGQYWSSTDYAGVGGYYVKFDSSKVSHEKDYRYWGHSVRLVTECQ